MEFSWKLELPRDRLGVVLAVRLARSACTSMGLATGDTEALVSVVHAAARDLWGKGSAPTFWMSLSVDEEVCRLTVQGTDLEKADQEAPRAAPDSGGARGRPVGRSRARSAGSACPAGPGVTGSPVTAAVRLRGPTP
ncbi:hypothetical protein AW27_029965 [Streptomyces sp. PCS3-D2]|uniref:hypothetical protein n=1 Tax=Streptomyces sp. PCS3-D2 TaxID=1460244 RepID=UPI00044B65B1|nr:hypothetical protein [Streptomyces sp. PCS3-D2]WKV75380.1 hypothetical protein AW27_029965 [Streptomyces sp. PCS3-D2]